MTHRLGPIGRGGAGPGTRQRSCGFMTSRGPRRKGRLECMSDDGVVTCPACSTRNRVPRVARGVPRCASCHASLPWLVAADDRDFAAVAEEASVPVLVDLWAPWCGPCRMVAPAVERVAHELAGHLKAVKVNVDESPAVAGRYQAKSIPR